MVLRLVFVVLALILPSAVHGTFATLYQFNGGVDDVNKSAQSFSRMRRGQEGFTLGLGIWMIGSKDDWIEESYLLSPFST
jgi:hypothetical protein